MLYAQPIVDVSSGDVVQNELLLRLRDADGEIIGPGRVPAHRRAVRPDRRHRPLGRRAGHRDRRRGQAGGDQPVGALGGRPGDPGPHRGLPGLVRRRPRADRLRDHRDRDRRGRGRGAGVHRAPARHRLQARPGRLRHRLRRVHLPQAAAGRLPEDRHRVRARPGDQPRQPPRGRGRGGPGQGLRPQDRGRGRRGRRGLRAAAGDRRRLAQGYHIARPGPLEHADDRSAATCPDDDTTTSKDGPSRPASCRSRRSPTWTRAWPIANRRSRTRTRPPSSASRPRWTRSGPTTGADDFGRSVHFMHRQAELDRRQARGDARQEQIEQAQDGRRPAPGPAGRPDGVHRRARASRRRPPSWRTSWPLRSEAAAHAGRGRAPPRAGGARARGGRRASGPRRYACAASSSAIRSAMRPRRSTGWWPSTRACVPP